MDRTMPKDSATRKVGVRSWQTGEKRLCAKSRAQNLNKGGESKKKKRGNPGEGNAEAHNGRAAKDVICEKPEFKVCRVRMETDRNSQRVQLRGWERGEKGMVVRASI